MNHNFYYLICLTLFSCTNNSDNHSEIENEVSIDTMITVSTPDTITSDLDSNTIESYETDVLVETKAKIEKEYGEQWDFCDCIFKTDSIQNAIEKVGDISDKEFDKIMSRFEEIDQHCKTIIASPNTTPEQRKAHERKVKKCLKNKR